MLVGYIVVIVFCVVVFWGFFFLGLLGGWLAAKIMRLKSSASRRDMLLAGLGGIGGVVLFFIIAGAVLRYSSMTEGLSFVLLFAPIVGGMVPVWLAHRNEVASKPV